ncbi:MAG: hypothetical protein ACREE6_15090, partial [Limisphaerales bacterium]
MLAEEETDRTDWRVTLPVRRSLLEDKVVVSWQGEPGELGRRLHWEALRNGLGRAHDTLFLGD